MVDVLCLLGEHKLEVMDETLLFEMEVMVEVLLLLQNVELLHNVMVMDETHYMVIDEIEQMQ